MTIRHATCILAAVAAAVLSACTDERARHALAGVEFAGCADVRDGPHCAIAADDPITVWIPEVAADRVGVVVGRRAIDVAAESEVVDGGLRLRVKPELLPSTIGVVMRDDPGGEFTLTVDRAPARAWADEARALSRERQFDRAAELLESARRTADDAEQGYALSRLARLEMQRGRAPAADALLVRALAIHRTHGRRSAEAGDAAALAYQRLNRDDDPAAASAVLDAVTQRVPGDSRSEMSLARLRGDIARRHGDPIAAEDHYREAFRRATRVDDAVQAMALRVGLAQLHAEAGRFARAIAQLAGPDASALAALSPCDRARFHNTRAWIGLLSREARVAVDDPMPDLERAREILARECPDSTVDVSNVLLNIALADVQRGDAAGAANAVRAARDASPRLPSNQEAWALEIEARIEEAKGDTDAALARYRELEERAAATLLIDAQWRAALGQAAILARRGAREAAIDAASRADGLLSDYVRSMPSSDDRALYLARHEAVPRLLVGLLVDAGRTHDAWRVARRYRIEALMRLQRLAQIHRLPADAQARWRSLVSDYRRLQREIDAGVERDWQTPVDALAAKDEVRSAQRRRLRDLAERAANVLGDDGSGPVELRPAADELVLLYFPVVDGWVGFAHGDDGLAVRRIGALDADGDPSVSSERLLGPFRDAIGRHSRIGVMAFGPLRDLDFHRLPWNGATLGTQRRVSYPLDLAPLAADDVPLAHALLVGDPDGDLPHARAEIARVDGTLREREPAVAVERMVGDTITTMALHGALAHAGLFHFAGHTIDRRGDDTQSGLALAGGRRFDLGDILTLERAPRVAVLSTCSGAAGSADAAGETLSVAHAFLVRGSREVVATTRPVRDREAALLIDALYRGWAIGRSTDVALADAQSELASTIPGADWAAFRLYTR